uniref:Uncharacterized protein n=1 Tax=Cucumis melo TaxID=3656 RepID=A0A9I9E6C1_CUCME
EGSFKPLEFLETTFISESNYIVVTEQLDQTRIIPQSLTMGTSSFGKSEDFREEDQGRGLMRHNQLQTKCLNPPLQFLHQPYDQMDTSNPLILCY